MKVAEAKEVHSRDEIAEAIRALTPAQWARLHKAAHYFGWAYNCNPDDLLQEAFCRLLGGSRSWPNDIDLVRTLVQAIRSIANGESERLENQVEIVPVAAPGAKIATAIDVSNNKETQEEEMMMAEQEEALRLAAKGLFPQDTVAQDLIDGILSGYEGQELRELTDLTETGYASKRRLVRRTINTLIPATGKP